MDIIAYFKNICNTLVYTRDTYTFAKVSGLSHLEEVLEDRKNNRWLAVDESQDGNTFRGNGGGFFERRFYTVFLIFKMEKRGADRAPGMAEVRTIYKKIHSKIIRDRKLRQDMFFIEEELRFNEIEYIGDNCAGLMFHLTNDEAKDLQYNPDDWIE